MRDLIREVLTLQSEWTALPTPAMVRRGRIIEHEIPEWIRARLPELTAIAPATANDLDVDASDGAGAKARIPWTRVFSRGRSPGASEGWYVVFLFAAAGGAAYLSINQGSTRWDHGNFDAPRSAAELAHRAEWARETVKELLAARSDLVTAMDLEVGRRDLGARYQSGNVAAFRYPLDAIPEASAIAADLQFLIRALGAIYLREERALQLPGDPAPEVADAITAAGRAASPLRRFAGFRLSHAERVAIERHAVGLAMDYLRSTGFTHVRDVGAKKSYDLEAYFGDLLMYVEVKGTTTAGEQVVLTKNEVEWYRRQHPTTMLIVVAGMSLDRTQTPPIASGGSVRRLHPWMIEPADLTPISYTYEVPSLEE